MRGPSLQVLVIEREDLWECQLSEYANEVFFRVMLKLDHAGVPERGSEEAELLLVMRDVDALQDEEENGLELVGVEKGPVDLLRIDFLKPVPDRVEHIMQPLMGSAGCAPTEDFQDRTRNWELRDERLHGDLGNRCLGVLTMLLNHYTEGIIDAHADHFFARFAAQNAFIRFACALRCAGVNVRFFRAGRCPGLTSSDAPAL